MARIGEIAPPRGVAQPGSNISLTPRTERLTTAQALVRFLAAQYVERDGATRRAFGGCCGIFGHANLGGVAQALHQYADRLTYYQSRNEQAMVHTAVGFARMRNRLQMLACTSSIGPGATNMITGAALASVDRIPVLLLPSDIFASRRPDPVLQQLEVPSSGDMSINDAFRPVSRYWDRISRPEQIVPAALAAMRVLTNPADTGAVVLSLPQDVQTEAFDVPVAFLEDRVWHVERRMPDEAALARASVLIRGAKRPLIVAGGGVIYSEASEALRRFAEMTGIPVAETHAGKGSVRFDDPASLGALGLTGGLPANQIARGSDLVIGIGTRWTDFTTMSKSAFEDPDVRFININVAEFDAAKHAGVQLVGDARRTLEALSVGGYRVDEGYRAEVARLRDAWNREVDRLYALGNGPLPARSEIIGAVNDAVGERGVVVCGAGALPGELNRLWRARDPKQSHADTGYSTMGYEIAGGLGAKMAAPDREVFVLVGDGSYLMMHTEIVTAVQEDLKLVIVLVDDHGFSSIGGLSRRIGNDGFGTISRVRRNGALALDSDLDPAAVLPIDYVANAKSLGADAVRVRTIDDLRNALSEAQRSDRTRVIVVEADRQVGAPSYSSWWDLPVSEISDEDPVRQARARYEDDRQRRRWLL